MPIPLAELEQRPRDDGEGTLYFRKDGTQVCGSKMRRKDPELERCNSPFVYPHNGRCRLHGALSGRPVSTSRWATKLPERLARGYVAWREDEDSLKDESATLAAFATLAERASERLDEADTPEWRARCRTLVREAKAAFERDDSDTLCKRLSSLDELTEKGAEEDAAFETLRDTLRDFAFRQDKVADREVKRDQVVTSKGLHEAMAVCVSVLVEFAGHDVGLKAAAELEKRLKGRASA